MSEIKPSKHFLNEEAQAPEKKLHLSPMPLILLVAIVLVMVLVLLRPQTTTAVSAQTGYIDQANDEAKIIINGIDQTQALQTLPKYSLSWLEPRDIHWQHIKSFNKTNGQFVLIFRDGSERRITADEMRWLPRDVQQRLNYERSE